MNLNCPVCDSKHSYLFLERKNTPIFQNIIIPDQSVATQLKDGKISLLACQECGFVFNGDFNENKIIYNQAYENCQFHSNYFNNYVSGLIEYLLEEYKIRNSRIIEIGCGQGEFLKKLVENPKYGNYGFGFDPSYRGEDILFDGRLSFQKDYYSEKYIDIDADIIVCRHVIEHISDPLMLLGNIRKALRNPKETILFFETPCINWILENHVFWDFFYEHCSYFNMNSILTAFSSSGLTIRQINHIFEGQYLWAEAAFDSGTGNRITQEPFCWREFKQVIDNFVKVENLMVNNWRNKISALHQRNYKVAIWGAGAKGVTFANLIDPNCNLINCAIDINPNKQGNYIPGTGHLITNVESAVRKGGTHAIIMNPNYMSEIQEILALKNIDLKLIKLM
ncbi:class I SAM-dependent methyltransferase [Sporomusa malonica]|uniref:C-methyltransferase C-terminal domain-containing protein n=1 Tax=Sporomusa malonica TaxID=112901 RepID=A0A1W2EUS5_9FIRM|nr:class I SAM-dependent methyltransferase [Sporomusa malonica]SMD13474.1 C-methyltransferase C-terminal domain-containing protein [Sporomusa malonica]